MALALKKEKLMFHSTPGDEAHRQQGTVVFDRAIRDGVAAVTLKGFELRYNGTDHEVQIAQVLIHDPSVRGSTVIFNVDVLLRDKNGDDRFEGWVEVVIIADLI